MNVGSLFSGIGGFDLGLERAGMRVVWQCESDDFCRRVLAKHWPDVPCFDDVRNLSRTSGTPPVDVLCGGFPCQDISVAGKGAGITGARSGLWSEYARLIGELRPRYVVVENVSALLARGMGRVLGDLAALGYDAEWDCIPASAVGAPHQRDRIWLVAYPGGEWSLADAGRERGSVGGEAGDVAAPARRGQGARQERQRDGHAFDDRRPDVAYAHDAGREQRRRPVAVPAQQPAAKRRSEVVADPEGERRGAPRSARSQAGADLGLVNAGWWLVEPDVGRVADGVPQRVDRLRAIGNALVPQIAQWIGERIVSYEAAA